MTMLPSLATRTCPHASDDPIGPSNEIIQIIIGHISRHRLHRASYCLVMLDLLDLS